jgi:CBS domain-containing protein
MAKLARELMTRNPACGSPDTPLIDVARLMVQHDCGEIPIVNASRQLVGVVTDRDIVCRVVAEGRNPNGLTAEAAMSTPVVSLPDDADLDTVVHTMARHQIRRLLIVDENRCCAGIIAQADIAADESPRTAGELVRDVSRAE